MNPATLAAHAAAAIRVKSFEWLQDPQIYTYEYLELMAAAIANHSRVETYAQIIMEQRKQGNFKPGIYDKILVEEFGYSDDLKIPENWWPKGLNHGIQKIHDKYHSRKVSW